MKDKNVGLQILRGLAAWSVVFHHYNQLFLDLNTRVYLDIYSIVEGNLV
ncbi:hypothetical protein M973_08265 [Francisella orientalis LADL 07-285A]|nr:hypothetical protein M973_08265 [Francisella orientalis LADL 07-285A]